MGYDLDLDPSQAVYTHARAFSMHRSFEVAGAVDGMTEKRELFEKFYHKPVFNDLRDALKNIDPELVVIATPTERHKAVMDQVIEFSNVKVILCEKPLSYSIEEARVMVQNCERYGIKLFVNYMRRSDPGVIEVQKRIQSGRIASPVKGIAWYSKGLLNNGSHFFNLLEFWLGSYIKNSMLSPGRSWNDHDSEPDFTVEFEKGRVIFMAAWEECFSHYTIELLSTAGRLRYDKGGEIITFEGIQPDANFSGYTILSDTETIGNEMYRSQWNVVDQLSNALQDRPASICNGIEALHTLEAINQIISQR